MTAFNKRQLNLMLERLLKFQQRSISLSQLVSDLEGLVDSLENPNAEWKDLFLRQWGILEDVYADSDDRQIAELVDEQQALLTDAVSELLKLVAQEK